VLVIPLPLQRDEDLLSDTMCRGKILAAMVTRTARMDKWKLSRASFFCCDAGEDMLGCATVQDVWGG
jgi:hypothetical protein